MVFDKRIDKSLWLMMAGDRENRDNIANFIKIIPIDMYNYICEKIQENEIYAIRGHSKGIEFEHKIMLGTDGFIYELDCAILFGVLRIKLHRYTVGMAIDEKFELTLSVLHDKDLSFGVNHYDIEIGSFSYDGKTTDLFGFEDKHISYKRRYCIKKVRSGKLSVYPLDCKLFRKIISVSDIPNEMYLEDLSSNDRISNLVKSRKRVGTIRF